MEKLKAPALPAPSPENTQASDEVVYIPCPECAQEYTRMCEDGLCPDCSKAAAVARSKRARQTLLIEACLGHRGNREFKFEGYKQSSENAEAFKAAMAFDPAKDNLYFYGSCGSGKTHLAGAAWRRRVEEGLPCEFLKHPELSRLFRKKEADEEKALLKKFAEFAVLVIDDVGVGRSTEFSNQILYEIVDYRLNNDKNGMILTSNLSPEEFAAKVGDDRLPSRIFGMCKVIKVTGHDHRLS